MDFPKTVPGVNLLAGQFTDGNPAEGVPASLDPAEWANAVTNELLNVIAAGGETPDETKTNQLLAAIQNIVGSVATAGRLLNARTLTGSGTYTPAAGTHSIIIEAVGGGGAGGGAAASTSTASAAGAGGSSGAYAKVYLTEDFSDVEYSCGAGGTAAAAGNNAGGTGGATTFGTFLTCPGGPGGGGSAAIATPSIGGSNGGGTALPTCTEGTILLSLFGEGGADGINFGSNSIAGQGANSPLGIGGWPPTGIGARPASGYGAGSSGANNQGGGAPQASVGGSPGVIIVYEYA